MDAAPKRVTPRGEERGRAYVCTVHTRKKKTGALPDGRMRPMRRMRPMDGHGIPTSPENQILFLVTRGGIGGLKHVLNNHDDDDDED